MIYSLNGKLVYYDNNSAVVECGGVGYRCTVTAKTVGALPKLQEDVFLFTYMAVREDSVDLFGFANAAEMDCFKMLTAVNGVGPKMGIAILSQFLPEEVYAFIAAGDYKSLTAANGVGPKLAQRIVLELKDKVGHMGTDLEMSAKPENAVGSVATDSAAAAVSALVSLGFTGVEARSAVSKLDRTLPTEDLIRKALALLSSGRY